jgi:hypothetical protein
LSLEVSNGSKPEAEARRAFSFPFIYSYHIPYAPYVGHTNTKKKRKEKRVTHATHI